MRDLQHGGALPSSDRPTVSGHIRYRVVALGSPLALSSIRTPRPMTASPGAAQGDIKHVTETVLNGNYFDHPLNPQRALPRSAISP